jgi:hypothetical protein
LANEGTIGVGEIHVVHSEESLPELVIAARGDESAYYERELNGVARLLEEDTSTSAPHETVSLLKSLGVCRLVPVSEDRVERARRLFGEFGYLFESTQVVRP